MNRWFRVYDESINDPKILRLPLGLRWYWVAMLCAASKSDGLIKRADASLYLRLPPKKANDIVAELIAAELLDRVDDQTLTPHNWNGRQYKTDVTDPTNADRQKRYRARHAVTEETVTVPVTVTDTRADTEQIQSRSEEKKEAHASRGAALPDDWAPSDSDLSYVEKLGFSCVQAIDGAEEMKLWAWANKNRSIARKANWSLTYRSWMRRTKRGTSNGQAAQNNGLRDALAQLGDHIGEDERRQEGSEAPPRLLSNG